MAPSYEGGPPGSMLSGKRANSYPKPAREPVDRSYNGHTSIKAKPKNYCGCGELSAQPAHGPYLRCLGWQPETDTWAGSALFVCKPSVSERPVLSWQDSEGHAGRVEPDFLDSYCDWNFWRFALEVPMSEQQKSVDYWLEDQQEQKNTFYVAGREQPWHWGYYSCNGLTEIVDEKDVREKWHGIDPLWNDVLQRHAASPMHAMVGGGDQLYCDDVMMTPALQAWFEASPSKRITMEWSEAMNKEVEEYYFHHYAVHFSYGPFGRANASIPSVLSYDDHDVFDGWGSYPTIMANCPVFQGIIGAGKRFFLLFQLHTTHELSNRHGCFGRHSYNQLMLFGPRVAVAMPDCRSERTRHQVLSLETHMGLVVKVQEMPDSVRHLVLCTTVPVVYPTIFGGERTLGAFHKLNKLKPFTMLLKATGLYSAIFSKYGEPSLLDDLKDHWNATTHKEEQRFLIEHMQMLAKSKLLRVSMIAGDVHLAATGRLYTRPKQDLRHDFRYMPQIVSSAIANAPPPDALVKLLSVTGRAGHVNKHTAHKMVKTFQGNARLLNERNWCEIWELDPRGAASAGTTSAALGGGAGGAAAGGAAASAVAGGGGGVSNGPTAANGVHPANAMHSTGSTDGRHQDLQGRDQTAGAEGTAGTANTAKAATATTGSANASAPAANSHALPEVQRWHQGEAEPGALVFALRVEHLSKKPQKGAVLREYQTIVPRLERPDWTVEEQGAQSTYQDAEPFGHGKGWAHHSDREQYARSVRNPNKVPTDNGKDKLQQTTTDTMQQTGAA